MTRTNSLRQAIIPALLVLSVGACAPAVKHDPKIVEISTNKVTHAVVYDNGHEMLSVEELNNLSVFLTPINPLAIDHVLIEHGDASPLTDKRLSKLEKVLVEKGIPTSVIGHAISPGAVSSMLTLHVQYSVAGMPADCPNWKQHPVLNDYNQNMSNLGCATAANMAKHVAHPRDLVVGQGSNRPDPYRDTRAIQRYTDGAATTTSGSSGSSSGSGSESSSSGGGESGGAASSGQ